MKLTKMTARRVAKAFLHIGDKLEEIILYGLLIAASYDVVSFRFLTNLDELKAPNFNSSADFFSIVVGVGVPLAAAYKLTAGRLVLEAMILWSFSAALGTTFGLLRASPEHLMAMTVALGIAGIGGILFITWLATVLQYIYQIIKFKTQKSLA